MALHFARIMWEGHIAFRWSSNNGEAVQRHFEDFREEKHWPRGSWPLIGDMAKHLPDQFDSEGYQQLHSNYRRTHNELFSHAGSDWALATVLGSHDESEWSPAVGPTFDAYVVQTASDHLVPLCMWLLVDIGEFVAAMLGSAQRKGEVDALLDAAQAWIASHPPPITDAS